MLVDFVKFVLRRRTVKPDAEIFKYRQVGKYPPPLRHITEAQPGNQMRLNLIGPGISKSDRATTGRGQPHDAPERRRLTNAVTAQKGHGLAVPDLEVHPLQDVACAGVRVQPLECKH